jgi:ribosomal protein L32
VFEIHPTHPHPSMPAIFAKTIESKSRRRLQNLVDAQHLPHPIVIKQNDKGYTLNGRLGSVTYEGRFLGSNFRAAKIALDAVLA